MDTQFGQGDALHTEDDGQLTITATEPLDALLFDLP
jgi:hypothetical protein